MSQIPLQPGDGRSPRYVRVAVPLPLDTALVYEVPEPFSSQAVPGARVRVHVGRRKLTGVILERCDGPPENVATRPLEAVVDPIPVLPADLLEIAGFVADYYLAPVGEVLRAMLPARLPPWGDQRVWLTDAGALARPSDPEEQTLVDALREAGRMRLSELQAVTGLEGLYELVGRLKERGRLVVAESGRQGTRYVTAVELAAGTVEQHLAACGRSAPGRRIVEYLATLGRPATVEELTREVGCTAAVPRRLHKLGVLRRFTQAERLGLEAHRLGSGAPADVFALRPDQQEAVDAVSAALEERRYGAFLLTGITGSGKTEVYLRAVSAVLEQGRSAILLVPEIALVPALARDLGRRFADHLAILHSALSAGERHQEWERIRRGEARVVLGPRSAVFAPVPDLGLIVVDEEHDTSYKQDSTPRYHGRDLALVRAHREGATALLVSATPSLETRHNVTRGKLGSLSLRRRVGQGELPEGILVDLREEGATRKPGEVHYSERLRRELEETFALGDQAILLRNRRGYAPILLCRACGEDMRCPDCGLPRTLHLRDRALRCHYCGDGIPSPAKCPSCGEEALEPIGAGTERVEEDFRELFPGVPVAVLDRDTTRRRGGVAAVLESFGRGDTQALIGTQMVSKGHHFPGVAVTAVLLADTYLGFPDFRAVERTYSLLTQLAGRAGRGERRGRVVIQTYHPDHYAVRAALVHDDAGFAAEEMRFRRIFHYPPFSRMVQLLVQDDNRERGRALLAEVASLLLAHPLSRGVRLLGPASAPFERLRGKWRFQLLLRGASSKQLRSLLRAALSEKMVGQMVIDVDPFELL